MSVRSKPKHPSSGRLHHVLRVGFAHKQHILAASRFSSFYTLRGEDQSPIIEEAEVDVDSDDDGGGGGVESSDSADSDEDGSMQSDDDGFMQIDENITDLFQLPVLSEFYFELRDAAAQSTDRAASFTLAGGSMFDGLMGEYEIEYTREEFSSAMKLAYMLYFNSKAESYHMATGSWAETRLLDTIDDLADSCYTVSLYEPIINDLWNRAMFRAPETFTTRDYSRTLTPDDYKRFVQDAFYDYGAKRAFLQSLPDVLPMSPDDVDLDPDAEPALLQVWMNGIQENRDRYYDLKRLMFLSNCPIPVEDGILGVALNRDRRRTIDDRYNFPQSFDARFVRPYLDAVPGAYLSTYIFVMSPVHKFLQMESWKGAVSMALRNRERAVEEEHTSRPRLAG